MAHSFNQTRPLGGLDMDSEARSLTSLDYVYGLNIRNAIVGTGKQGTLTNISGNLEVDKYVMPYTGGTTLPAGDNKCIGAFEDTKRNTIIYFVWNSNNDHSILRYYADRTNPSQPLGEIQQVISYDFGWTKDTQITSASIVYGTEPRGDLLYWIDPVPKKINLDKANICYKQKSWDVILPLGYAGQSFFFQVVVRNFVTNGPVASINVLINAGLTIQQMFESLTNQINAGLSQYVTAENCGCSMTITENVENGYLIVFTEPSFLVIPANWYGLNLEDRYFDRCKWQPMQSPQNEYAQDTNYEPNYVDGKVFQFRLQYIYDDYEYSSLGVWSQIAINNLGCDGTTNSAFNYIDVNFNDPLLLLPTTLVLLKKVRLVARELNTGNDRFVIELEPCEFLDLDGSTVIAHYKFYNNIESSAVDPALASKLFDNIPLEAGAEVFSKNRIIDGDILEGYDAPPCASASYEIDFEDEASIPTYTVTFLVRVFNAYFDNNQDIQPRTVLPNILERRSGIFYNDLGEEETTYYPYFGGAMYQSGQVELFDEAQTVFKQLIPEGGWPVYAAGTPYYAISRQIAVPKLTQRSDGSIDITGTLDTADFVKQWFQDGTNEVVAGNPIGEYDLYSVVQIKVPRGKYVFRPASHLCSFEDKLGKGEMYNLNNGTAWQVTSTYVWGTIDQAAGTYSLEKEITVDVTGDVFGGEFIIADTCYYNVSNTFTNAATYTGYLIDNLGQTDIPALQQGVRVEKAKIQVTGLTTPQVAVTDFCITDHNGFFFIMKGTPINLAAVRLTASQIKNGGAYNIKLASAAQYKSTNKSALNDLQTTGLVPQVNLNVGYLEYIVPVGVQTARDNSSTFLQGTVSDSSGNAVSDVLLVYQNGRAVKSDANGAFSILAWNDMQQNNLVPSNQRTVDDLIVNYGCGGTVTYPNGQTFTITIFPFNPNYSPTIPYLVTGVLVDASTVFGVKAHKRGGNFPYVLRYYDNQGRNCTCVAVFDIYVPFITEDLNKTLPNQYPANTFKYGFPTISWTLSPGFNPPEWAAYYQWMRTKNTITDNYLQWVVNGVTYLSKLSQDEFPEIETAYANGDAVAVKLSISNIIDFARTNPLSQVSYTFQEGDRLRLIANRDGTYFNGVTDLEVVSFTESDQSLIVKLDVDIAELFSGAYIEIFNPKNLTDNEERIFYEVGEVYECTAPNTPNNQHSVTSGTFTNGDTYWRQRVMVVNDDRTNYAAVYPLTIEDSSISDFYSSKAQDIGRIGIVDPDFRQEHNQVLMRFSNAYLAINNNINGLSSIESENYLELDRAYGSIQALVFTQNTLVVIGSNREISQYLGQTTLQQGTTIQSGIVALSDSFFGAPYVHSRMLGTDNKATVTAFNGQIFGLANYIGNVWRYQGDGEAAISDVKMTSYFQQLSEDGVSKAIGVFDRYHEEYILTAWRKYEEAGTLTSATALAGRTYNFTVTLAEGATTPNVGDEVTFSYYLNGEWNNLPGEVASKDGTDVVVTVNSSFIPIGTSINLLFSLPETIAWFNGTDAIKGDKWASFRSYTPEAYGVLNSNIYSFVDGKLWKHDVNPVNNNFYGVQYDSKLTPVFNMEPDFLKVWNACILMQQQANNANDWSAPVITNSNGQESRLKKGAFTKKGEHWYAAFKRDLNDLTVASNLRISQGRALRSTSLTCNLVNDYTGEVKLYGWDANWTASERTTK